MAYENPSERTKEFLEHKIETSFLINPDFNKQTMFPFFHSFIGMLLESRVSLSGATGSACARRLCAATETYNGVDVTQWHW
jgi:hypothetical protein